MGLPDPIEPFLHSLGLALCRMLNFKQQLLRLD